MRFAPLLLSLPILLSATGASAQLPSIDARTWRPSTDPSAGLVLEPTTTPGPWNWNVGALLSYSYRPVSLALNEPTLGSVTLRPVESLLGLDLVAGLGLGSRISVGASLPTALDQTGTKPLPTTVSASGTVPQTAIGDLALNGKATLIDDSQGGFGLAALGTVTIPTGERASYMGEGSVTVGARLIAEYTLLVATLQASLGYTLRIDQRTWPDASVGGNGYGDTIPWSVVLALKPDVLKLDKGHRQRWELGAHGWLPAGPVAPFVGAGAAQESPALLSLADRIEIGHYRDTYVVAGAEVGLDNAVGTPIVRAILGFGWSPRNHDMDRDGVPDDVDQCPELPEDRDGFEDSDGCPEIDNDDDGILDTDDACPNVAGVASPDPKKNGCPQPDRDKDGVPDDVDQCPDQKGIETDDPKTTGCPRSGDRDKDGVPDRSDQTLPPLPPVPKP
jgi:OmpA-OmpF porin, OOP family